MKIDENKKCAWKEILQIYKPVIVTIIQHFKSALNICSS